MTTLSILGQKGYSLRLKLGWREGEIKESYISGAQVYPFIILFHNSNENHNPVGSRSKLGWGWFVHKIKSFFSEKRREGRRKLQPLIRDRFLSIYQQYLKWMEFNSVILLCISILRLDEMINIIEKVHFLRLGSG